MKKLKHEAELVKGTILAGVKYGVGRGAVVFEPTDSASEKIRFIKGKIRIYFPRRFMNETRTSGKRNVIAALVISLALFAVPLTPAMAAGRTLTMQKAVALAAPDSANEAIRKECRIEEGMAELIAIHASLPFEKVVRVDRVSGDLPGKVLAMTIVKVSALGGGRFTGQKHITMEGTLWDNGQVVGSFRGRWEIGGAASACGSVSFLARSLGLDIGNWLLKPTVGARFGNPS